MNRTCGFLLVVVLLPALVVSPRAPIRGAPPEGEAPEDVLDAKKTLAARKAIARLRMRRLARQLAALRRHTVPPVEAIQQVEAELAGWRTLLSAPAEGVPVRTAVGVLTRGRAGQRDEWGKAVLHMTPGHLVPPVSENLRATRGRIGRMAIIRFARVFPEQVPAARGAAGAALVLSVEPTKDADVQAVARKNKLPIVTVEGVPYRTDRDAWELMPDRQSRRGPFYRVLGTARGSRSLKSLHFKWGRFTAVSFRGPGVRRHLLYILSAELGKAADHERAIAQAKSSEAFHLGGGGAIRP